MQSVLSNNLVFAEFLAYISFVVNIKSNKSKTAFAGNCINNHSSDNNIRKVYSKTKCRKKSLQKNHLASTLKEQYAIHLSYY